MYNPDAPVTKAEFMKIHNIGDWNMLARLIAEHPNNNAGGADADDDAPHDPATDPDYVPNPPYAPPAGVASWSEWCR
ncbi:hypothetical protein [Streptomyces sp. 5-6(2022)]|uniref:hypothetical protein n=1 Tax=Streptomyces sp. 5-6(2022) TaxID=2936510 RepID=UPI0023B9C893|nr:hypothetical protein [Streptomyces sp. 5-6(2022)]